MAFPPCWGRNGILPTGKCLWLCLKQRKGCLYFWKENMVVVFFLYWGMWKRSQIGFFNSHNKNNLFPWLIRFCFPVMCDIIIICSVLQSVSWREGNGVAEIWMANLGKTQTLNDCSACTHKLLTGVFFGFRRRKLSHSSVFAFQV